MYSVDYNSYRSIKGYGRRIRFLVMHYTAVDFATSVKLLSGDGQASAHYLVPDPTEQTYIDAGFKELRLFNLVEENQRAWHAGVSYWAGRNNLNDTSIGIEIVNLADEIKGHFYFPPYPAIQVDAIKQLAQNILQRYPDITPTNVIGHNDISPGRKSDPGAAFPWKELYDAGIGASYDEQVKLDYQDCFTKQLPDKNAIMAKLARYGYDTLGTQSDVGYRNLIRAFQLHFRQENYGGEVDAETAAILYALVDKYFS